MGLLIGLAGLGKQGLPNHLPKAIGGEGTEFKLTATRLLTNEPSAEAPQDASDLLGLLVVKAKGTGGLGAPTGHLGANRAGDGTAAELLPIED